MGTPLLLLWLYLPLALSVQWVLQLHSLPKSVASLEAEIGVKVEHYMGNSEFVVFSADERFPERAKDVSLVKGVTRRGSRAKTGSLGHGSVRRSYENSGDCEMLITLISGLNMELGNNNNLTRDWQNKTNDIEVVVVSSRKVLVRCPCGEDFEMLGNSLAEDERVEAVERRSEIKIRNNWARSVLTGSYHLASLESNPIWAMGLKGEGQVIGIADTGIDMDNCMFWEDSLLPLNTVDPSRRKVIAYLTYSGASCGLSSNMPCADGQDDREGHGTHVSGSAAGDAKSPISQETERQYAAQYNGVAPGAQIVFTDIGRADGSLYPPVDLNEGLFPDAYNAGARIHSDSWGCASSFPGSCNVYDSTAREIDMFMWNHPDFLVVIAAGNSGNSKDVGTIESPATSKNILAVGSSQSGNQHFHNAVSYGDVYRYMCNGGSWSPCCNDNSCSVNACCQAVQSIRCCDAMVTSQINESSISAFSSRGPANPGSFGRIKPDIIAPGDVIISANSNGYISAGCQCSVVGSATNGPRNFDSALKAMAGTSMAAPLIAGIAALVRQYYVGGKYRNVPLQPSAALVKATIIAASSQIQNNLWRQDTRMSQAVPRAPLYSNAAGFGQPNLTKILVPDGVNQLWVVDDANGFSLTQEQRTYVISGLAASIDNPLVIVMVYTDYPAMVNAQSTLMNNLDLAIKWLSGSNVATQWGNDMQSGDKSNNVEKIIYTGSASSVNIVVSAETLLFSPQRFALVVHGRFASVLLQDSTNPLLSDNGDAAAPSSSKQTFLVVGLSVGGGMVLIAFIVVVVIYYRSNMSHAVHTRRPQMPVRNISSINSSSQRFTRRPPSLTVMPNTTAPPLIQFLQPSSSSSSSSSSATPMGVPMTPMNISMTPMGLIATDFLNRPIGAPTPTASGMSNLNSPQWRSVPRI